MEDKGFIVDDAGHNYSVKNIDVNSYDFTHSSLTFVKRVGKDYPGNDGYSYSGTTMQIVLRVVLDRLGYLQKQKPCLENKIITILLTSAIWLLEFRAARRHKILYLHTPNYAANAPICGDCGHTVCKKFKD